MGGIAGAFWVSNTAALSPEHFPWFWSLWLVGVILIGGVGSIQGEQKGHEVVNLGLSVNDPGADLYRTGRQ
ncbi:hypothetical protein ACFL9T_20845 [Thermodesulfobacteriota bacterium]